MAIGIIGDEDKNDNKDASGGAANPPPAAGTPPSQPTGGATGSQNQAQPVQAATTYNQPKNQQQGSGFTNLQRVVQANKQNQLGQVVGSGIQNQANQVTQGLGQAQQQFKQQTAANTLGSEANTQTRQSILDQIANATGEDQIAPDQRTIDLFAKYRSGQYTGPQSLQNADQLQQQAQLAQQLGQSATTSGGTGALLQRFVGQGPYTSGQRNLDQLILGQTGTGQLKQAAQSTFGLGNRVNEANSAAGQEFLTQQGLAQQFGQGTNAAIEAAQNPITQGLQSRVGQFQDIETEREKKAQAIQNILNTPGVDAKTPAGSGPSASKVGSGDIDVAYNAIEQAAQSGFATPEQIKQLSDIIPKAQAAGLNIREVLRDRFNDILAQNVNQQGLATGTEAAQLGALQQLAGKQNEYSKYGGATAGSAGFDVAAIQKYIDDAQRKKQGLPPAAIDNTPPPEQPINRPLLLTPIGQTQLGIKGYQNVGTGAAAGYYGGVKSGFDNLQQGNLEQGLTDLGTAQFKGQLGAAQGGLKTLGSLTGSGQSQSLQESASQVKDLGARAQQAAAPVLNAAVVNPATNAANAYKTQAQMQLQAQQDALQQLKSGRVDQAAVTEALSGLNAGKQLANDVASGIRDVSGNLTQLGQDVANGVRDTGGNIIKNITGGGGKIICTELHRQGYLSDEIMALDREFGKQLLKTRPKLIKGYLLIAKHIVPRMQKSARFTKAISITSIPWAQHMAHRMNPDIPDHLVGNLINRIGEPICLSAYYIHRLYIKCLK